jgi:hypothetical protein
MLEEEDGYTIVKVEKGNGIVILRFEKASRWSYFGLGQF